ncbi:uncharacterized protein LOC106869808 [Octopus bimaculoides]|uniref:Chitin-binding type-2 domain-containing protein n=1 Tax=Octopus bimaculoides TaxID=37653 RepID=A0A0L8HNJ5_OCTBM|nr:uncharacterized protein LOC106869808 [Octopus bimaculoides]|eukprot:XP_014771154.1 PREDICTED: uncharacterized protein LOC106869808 [Octopus bimaculoides]
MRLIVALLVFCCISVKAGGENVTSLCEMVAKRTKTNFVRSPVNCQEFFDCRGDLSLSTKMSCGKGTVFSQSLQVCVYRHSGFDDCDRAFYGGKLNDPLCKNDTGLNYDPQDCGRFIPCFDGASYPSMPCQKDLHFSIEHQRCVEPEESNCQLYTS